MMSIKQTPAECPTHPTVVRDRDETGAYRCRFCAEIRRAFEEEEVEEEEEEEEGADE